MIAALIFAALTLTEDTVVQSIATVGVILAALIASLGGWLGFNANRARKSAEATAHEFTPNSGSTLRDQTNRIEHLAIVLAATVDTLAVNQETQARETAALKRQLTKHLEQSAHLIDTFKEKKP